MVVRIECWVLSSQNSAPSTVYWAFRTACPRPVAPLPSPTALAAADVDAAEVALLVGKEAIQLARPHAAEELDTRFLAAAGANDDLVTAVAIHVRGGDPHAGAEDVVVPEQADRAGVFRL